MFASDDPIKRARQLQGDYEKVAKAIDNATSARKAADADLQASIRQLQEAIVNEAMGEGSPEVVTRARAAVAKQQEKVKSADELLDALRLRLVAVVAKMGDALPDLHNRVPEETEELKAQVVKDLTAAFAKISPLLARRRALERIIGTKIEVPEPQPHGPEPTASELAPARHYIHSIQVTLGTLIGESLPGVSEGRGLLAGCSPELAEIVRKAQAVAPQLQLDDIRRTNAERKRQTLEAQAAEDPRLCPKCGGPRRQCEVAGCLPGTMVAILGSGSR
ncbi:MAG TPA: hypothetical protein VN442_00325 [Bryobacteraceae bacterium]|nr:hypothetical protein [Bryobacteraceae bacterium]